MDKTNKMTNKKIANKMTNKKPASDRQRLANALNPLRTGKYAKTVHPDVLEFMKNPAILVEKIKEIADKLSIGRLDSKEQIQYGKFLTDIYRTLFGTRQDIFERSINVNLEIEAEKVAREKVIELINRIREGTGSNGGKKEYNMIYEIPGKTAIPQGNEEIRYVEDDNSKIDNDEIDNDKIDNDKKEQSDEDIIRAFEDGREIEYEPIETEEE